MSDCKAYRREIDEAADGGRMSSAARAHLALCRTCGDEVRKRESLHALVVGLGKVEAPADFEFRLRARMAAAKTGGGRGRFGGARWLYGFAPVAVAACFVVVSATLYFRQAARTTTSGAPVVASQSARNAEQDRAPSINTQSDPAKSAVESEAVVPAKQTDVASAKTHQLMRADVRTQARPARAVALRNERRVNSEQMTAVSSLTGARVLTITLKAPGEPLRMILRDERGAERVVPMRAVSFGSQDFLARETALRPSSGAEVGGVW